MKNLDEEVSFMKCEHERLATNCNVCFRPVFDSLMKFAKDMGKEVNELMEATFVNVPDEEFYKKLDALNSGCYHETDPALLDRHSPEFLRQT